MTAPIASHKTPAKKTGANEGSRTPYLWRREAPGLWCVLHASAIRAPARASFAKLVEDVVGSIRCPNCRNHARAYVVAHPPSEANGDDPFTWSWRFHNAVNERLGKPLVSLASASREFGYAAQNSKMASGNAHVARRALATVNVEKSARRRRHGNVAEKKSK